MKNIGITGLIVIVLVILGLLFFSFQVRETEICLVTTFGKPTNEIKDAGWKFKWPPPIQRIYKFDSRTRVFEADIGETTTRGAVPIIVNTYIVWKIAEPLAFFNAVGTVREAENKLLSQISDTQNKVIGKYSFSDFVNSDESKIKFTEIQDEMLADIQDAVRGNYGIEIKTLGIKQLKISEEVSKDVFERMRAERNRKTIAIITEGEAEADKIRTDAKAISEELLAAAEARALEIRGQGDAEAAQYYRLLVEADPELAMFLRDIEALKKTLEKRATVIISADTEPFKLLKEMPNIKPKNTSGQN